MVAHQSHIKKNLPNILHSEKEDSQGMSFIFAVIIFFISVTNIIGSEQIVSCRQAKQKH
jgi:hypothetical protein